jgi:hypothetical protein
MGEPDKKALAAAKPPPAERSWTFALNLTRTDGDGVGETALSWRQRLSPLDLVLVAAGFLLFVVEPLAVYLALTHYKGPLLAGRCAPSQDVVVLHQPAAGPPEHGGGSAPGYEEGGTGDVITPLYARDPSNLVMTPYVAPPPRPEPDPVREAEWKEALRAAAKVSAKRAEPATWTEAVDDLKKVTAELKAGNKPDAKPRGEGAK